MLTILTIIIGLVFVILLFSILASAVMEFFAGLLSLRGKNLLLAIEEMLGSATTKKFINHAYFKQLSFASREKLWLWKVKKAVPSYLRAESFSAILLNLEELDDRADDVEAAIEEMPDGKVKELLLFHWRQSLGDVREFRKKVETWFNEVMDRASGAYKRDARKWLFIIGLGVTLAFNADLLNVYHNLNMNATLRELVADQATVYVNTNAAPVAPNLANPNMDSARAQINRVINENIQSLEEPLGMGWERLYETPYKEHPYFWFYKIAGWLMMAFGISFGASFWFDLLNKLVNLRSAGQPPAKPVAGSGAGSSPGAVLTEPATPLFESKKAKPAPPSSSRTVRKQPPVKGN